MCLTFKSMINFELICIKWVSFFCLWISNSLSTICWEGYLSFHHWAAFASSSKISYLSLYRFIFGLSLLSCWSLCLFHHQYHSVLIFGAPKNWCFWTVLLEKTLESPLDCKEMQPVHSKGDQSWVFIGRTDAEAETPILWPPHEKSWLTGKDSDAGRDWRQEEKGTTEDEMAGWHHWLDGRESEWTPGVGDGQGGLACCDSWGCKELDMTERLNWTELNVCSFSAAPFSFCL